MKKVFLAVIAVIVVLAGGLMLSYNGLAGSKEAVETAEADVDTMLQRRAVKSVCNQEILHLRTSVIVDLGSPIRMLTCLGSACSYTAVPSKLTSPCASFGKCAGTQSRMIPIF